MKAYIYMDMEPAQAVVPLEDLLAIKRAMKLSGKELADMYFVVKQLEAERDEARAWARRMKAERDEWERRAIDIAMAVAKYNEEAGGHVYTTVED